MSFDPTLQKMSGLDGIACRVVAQFHESTKTALGTPLFKLPCPTSELLRELVRDALQEVSTVPPLRNDPKVICKLLRAIAGGTDTIARGHDTILISAVEMIEAFERKAK